jgi:hypothetical protein
MKRELLILPIILILLSCERQYIEINESSRPCFENNDTLVFVNQNLESDSFLIRMYYDLEYYSGSYKEKLDYYYIALSNGMMDSLVFSVGIGGAHDITWLESEYRFHTISSDDNALTITQNGNTYSNVIAYYQDTIPGGAHNPDSTYSKPLIKKLLYSDSHGIIRYEKQNGDIFKLQHYEN